MVFFIICSKLVNRTSFEKVPPISHSAISYIPEGNRQKLGNINLALDTARSMGCMVRGLKPNSILQQDQEAILALVWEIILVTFF